MATMKEVCTQLDLSYETLKYYCNEGLVPNHTRDKNNHRIFSEKDIQWISGLLCLRDCGMSIKDMKQYMAYAYEGMDSILKRKAMLEETKQDLEARLSVIQRSLDFIDTKQQYYDDVLAGKIALTSNLNLDEA
ncbi:transcriptional regulator [Erysipelothrix larvae]|uniref:Transcriptional regulator n=1 Tax=Erysipelothrix larvae TaxID=1514105 RepID=A0A0X8GYY9_9FIRM|nr:MerR family transcriptional regulator [Erysipelothrix larvae]AMC92834.1 transcriptional regulator [Erysipelothrix larvae]